MKVWWCQASRLSIAAIATVLSIQPVQANPNNQLDSPSPATTVEEWVAQLEATPTTVTGVRVEASGTSLQVVLETTEGEQLIPATRTIGNALVADLPNAVLALPSGNEFQQENPIDGIALISVTGLPGDRVRVAITGTDAPPVVEVRSDIQGLLLGVTPGGAGTTVEADAIQIVVTGEEDGYNPSESTATRTNTPLRDVPASVQVVPQQVLEDRQVNQLEEGVRTVAGVTPNTSSVSFADGFTIRGFGLNNSDILRNGLRDATSGQTSANLSNVERLEILRGPASVLFGSGSPGGVLNIITEQPQPDAAYEVELTLGSYEFFRPAFDLTGPLTDDRALLYRLNASYESGESFVDFVETERWFIAPVVQWAIGSDTTLTLETEYQSDRQPNYRGLPARGTVLDNANGEIPLDRNISEPDRDFINNRIWRLGYDLQHRFSEDWAVRNAFRASFFSYEQDSYFPAGLEPDDRTLNRGATTGSSSTDSFSLTTEVTGNFETGTIGHQILVGFDLYREDLYENEFSIFDFPSLDLFDPDYGGEAGATTFRIDNSTVTEFAGLFIQDQITLLDNLKLVLGGRLDFVEQTQEDFLADTETSQSDEAFSPRIGLVYQPIEPLSLYASFSRSFNPVVGRGFDNQLFEPERATQYEIGAKFDITDQFSATLALFDITRTNVLTSDPRDPNFSIQTGEQQSQGIELNVAGQILPGWNIVAGYALTDARVTEDNLIEEGNQLNNVPRNSASLWTTYEIQSGGLQGLGFGLGLFYVGEREGDLGNTFELPDYLRTDAAIFYRRDRLRLGLNFENLFDIDYYETADSDLRVYPGAPFTVRGTIAWEF
ncbi:MULTISPECIES: TonB-dependent siderophore receptor [unclassified Leptolyngbya]|uniref:TonB-dependent siderophore receptor n=1 Tax=unclassified Leptolyngbya TaxID=2650499 RepID=UPI00168349BB|nr:MULTISPECIES: TonB-dependent siderophore receptor [unclassified Leptolyngbya]MBD1908989.1 TonB-dependent siderophore receptor [Leptolyngbya sp. FACHB-8]MBD2153016.1 TonB-dependent siderophore receptor [Leptolyngbya sp. FACHB-16]